jgi:Holliday junction resolvasome RuvABC endonuclease subunit
MLAAMAELQATALPMRVSRARLTLVVPAALERQVKRRVAPTAAAQRKQVDLEEQGLSVRLCREARLAAQSMAIAISHLRRQATFVARG